MSDSSEEEDLFRFREAVDNSFVNSFCKSRTSEKLNSTDDVKPKSERYLETSAHYNDVKVPEEMQKKIGAKISNIIQKNIEFVDMKLKGIKKDKIRGGVKLFKTSEGYLTCEDIKDTYTDIHNAESKKLKNRWKKFDKYENDLTEDDKIKAIIVNGEDVLSKTEIKHWKSRRKEKLFKYKSKINSNVLMAID